MDHQLIIAIVAGLLLIGAGVFIYYWNRPQRKSERALRNFLKTFTTPSEIGKSYERFVGYMFETQGHEVLYNGLIKGLEDMGRNLIVENENEILIVQAKCWDKTKLIKEKHVFQLFGSLAHYKLSTDLTGRNAKAVIYSTANFSEVAKNVAKLLEIDLINMDFDRSYPVVKCSIEGNGEKYFYLPVDPFYDKVKVQRSKGEFYAHTVKEAVDRGFRRVGT